MADLVQVWDRSIKTAQRALDLFEDESNPEVKQDYLTIANEAYQNAKACEKLYKRV